MNKDPSEKEYKIKVGAKTKTVQVDYLARVEGEGAFTVKTHGNVVDEVRLNIFEPPRFFEGFMQGRNLAEAPDIAARICGICPVAYQISALNAMEQALGVQVPEYIHQLRRLIYCGEWIESHGLHVYMLHAPDFLGYQDAILMSKDFPEEVKRGLRLKKAGNELIRMLGGREVHPINMKVGGFYQLPKKQELLSLVNVMKQALLDAQATVRWVNTLPFPKLERSYEFVSMTHPDEYPMGRGTVVSTSGITTTAEEFENHFEEYHVRHSTALQSRMIKKGAYLLGPMARYNLNGKQLSPSARSLVQEIGFEEYCVNPFRSIIIRSLELVHACEEALRLISCYDAERMPAFVPFEYKAAIGYGLSEAPRGLLYHRYTVDDQGLIVNAKIAAPTSQNQKTIEEDLFDFVSQNISLPDTELTWRCEQAIRNYDPCISCSTHFLKLQRIHE